MKQKSIHVGFPTVEPRQSQTIELEDDGDDAVALAVGEMADTGQRRDSLDDLRLSGLWCPLGRRRLLFWLSEVIGRDDDDGDYDSRSDRRRQ